MTDLDPTVHELLDRHVPPPEATADWADVLARAGVSPRSSGLLRRRVPRRRVLLLASLVLAVAAGAITAVALRGGKGEAVATTVSTALPPTTTTRAGAYEAEGPGGIGAFIQTGGASRRCRRSRAGAARRDGCPPPCRAGGAHPLACSR